MTKALFGRTSDGRSVDIYTIENEHLIMKVISYGAVLQSFIQKDTGIDVSEGFDSVAGYEEHDAHIGAMIGRCANRIEHACFQLNGIEYHVDDNKGDLSLHGGSVGLDRRVFSAEEKGNQVIFTDLIPDGDEGYPGNLSIKITYTLMEDRIDILTEATTDKDTLLGITNHSYFNLDDNDSVLEDDLIIYADTYAHANERGTSLPHPVTVKGTPFDFTTFKKIGRDIEADDEQLIMARGYDHHFPIPGTGLRDFCECRGQNVKLITRSDLPGMHLYTSNYLDGLIGKNGRSYPARSAVCFEPEFFPNGINYESVEPKPILRVNETAHQEIQYILQKI
ncbi:MAG: galactose mutarotase [Erysipelotrichia bacterium]|nr:galactose mutarotase [Erysipelotrichia bacterium]